MLRGKIATLPHFRGDDHGNKCTSSRRQSSWQIRLTICEKGYESCSPIVVTVGSPPQTTIEGGLPMGLLLRDDRQMKALTGVSQAQFDFLLPAFSYRLSGDPTTTL